VQAFRPGKVLQVDQDCEKLMVVLFNCGVLREQSCLCSDCFKNIGHENWIFKKDEGHLGCSHHLDREPADPVVILPLVLRNLQIVRPKGHGQCLLKTVALEHPDQEPINDRLGFLIDQAVSLHA